MNYSVPTMLTHLPQLGSSASSSGMPDLAVSDGPHRLFSTSASPAEPYAACESEAADCIVPVPEHDELFAPVIGLGMD